MILEILDRIIVAGKSSLKPRNVVCFSKETIIELGRYLYG